MSNSLNTNPMAIVTDVTSWKATQTLNTGNQPATIQSQQFNRTATSQPGIRIYKIEIISTASTAASTIQFVDPNNTSFVLWQAAVAATTTGGTLLVSDSFDANMPMWRDFSTTGVTTSACVVMVWWRV